MMYYIYRLSDQQFLRGASVPLDFDPQIEAMQAYPEHLRPRKREERFDGTAESKKRPATAQEIQDWDDARADFIAHGSFDSREAKLIKAVAIYFAQQAGIPLATARAGILQIFKGLS